MKGKEPGCQNKETVEGSDSSELPIVDGDNDNREATENGMYMYMFSNVRY
jgi:hypothetical protein